MPFVAAWMMAALYLQFSPAEQIRIPTKNSAVTAGVVVAASLFSVLAIQRTSFTVVTMFESCSILPVVFIGVFCSRVKGPSLKLGPKKILVAFLVALGILIFQFADPETKRR